MAQQQVGHMPRVFRLVGNRVQALSKLNISSTLCLLGSGVACCWLYNNHGRAANPKIRHRRMLGIGSLLLCLRAGLNQGAQVVQNLCAFSSSASKAPEFEQSRCTKLQVSGKIITAPSSACITPGEAFGLMWRQVHAKNAPDLLIQSGSTKVRLIPSIKKLSPTLTDSRIKGELLLFFQSAEEHRISELLEQLREDLLAGIQKLERLPAERRETMIREALEVPALALAMLRNMRESLKSTGALDILPPELRQLVEVMQCDAINTDLDNKEAADRGAGHEAFAVNWAREMWPPPSHKVFASCYPLNLGSEQAQGMKLEIDAVVVNSMNQVVTLVEAKAGDELYGDLPKILRLREVCFNLGASVSLRVGRHGPEHVFSVGAKVPHIAYVLGVEADSVEDVVTSSGRAAEGTRMITRQLRHAVGLTNRVHVTSNGRARINFSQDIVVDTQRILEGFMRDVMQRVQDDDVSIWRVKST